MGWDVPLRVNGVLVSGAFWEGGCWWFVVLIVVEEGYCSCW